MKIIPVPHGLEDLVGKSGYRTPGLHLSTIYNDMYQELEPKRYVKGAPLDPLRLEAGLSFESILEEGIKSRLCGGGRPDEMVSAEGILFNPDLIIFNHCTRVGEIKLTWMSCRGWPEEASNNFPPKADKYVTQMACYCHCLETPYARLIGYFVNGEWDCSNRQKPPAPMLKAWDIEFSPRELREEWARVMSHAKTRKFL